MLRSPTYAYEKSYHSRCKNLLQFQIFSQKSAYDIGDNKVWMRMTSIYSLSESFILAYDISKSIIQRNGKPTARII